MASIPKFLKSTWNAFLGRDPTEKYHDYDLGYTYSGMRPDRYRYRSGNLKLTVSAVFNKIAVDCSQLNIRHVRVDKDDKFKEYIDSSLNYALSVSANINQSGRELIKDAVQSLLDEGVIAIVPIDTYADPNKTDSYNIETMKVAQILEWRPNTIRVRAFNDRTNNFEELTFEKRVAVIIENPFHTIMNEQNSLAQRLMRITAQLDRTNERISSDRLDLIVQLPYTVKTPAQQKLAHSRKKEIEAQLVGSKFGIAYVDGTEKIVQLNRPVENNLWEQAQELQAQLFNQLGFSQAILDGSADEKTMLNYQNRTIEPILTTIVENMERKWITKTARTQGQRIRFFKDPFKLVPVAQIADIADKFTRNEIMSSNELRAIIGLEPSKDPKANELRNSNLNHPDEEGKTSTVVDKMVGGEASVQNSKSLGNLSSILSKVSDRVV